MIVFNNKDLEQIAPVKIDDIRVSPIEISPVARQRIGFGKDFVRMDGGSRTVAVTFAILEQDKNKRYEIIQDIVEWAKPFEEGTLSLPMYEENRHLDCLCTGYPEPSYRQWWENKLRLVFTTFGNPYWTSDVETNANCGTSFTIGGTAPPLIRIERFLPSRVANQTYSANGDSMFFEQIPAGRLLIDLNKQTAQIGGSSIMQYFGRTSRFIKPVTGNITIAGTGTVIYRERWV